MLNEGSLFNDKRLGQSVTLSGRSVSKHMNATVNENITGVYDYKGDAITYADTDSVPGSTVVRVNGTCVTIENLFNDCRVKWQDGDKEYSTDERFQTLSYDPSTSTANYKPFNYVYRHKVSKPKWKITDEMGNEIIVTNDHSVMVERSGEFIEVKPADILETDVLISVVS